MTKNKEFKKDILKAYATLATEYIEKIGDQQWAFPDEKCGSDHILKILKKLSNGEDPEFENSSIDKTSRLFGFIQGVLCAVGVLGVDSERDNTRPIFQGIYHKYKMAQKTVEI